MERVSHPSYSTHSQWVLVSDEARASERRENNYGTQSILEFSWQKFQWERESLGPWMLAVNYNVTLTCQSPISPSSKL